MCNNSVTVIIPGGIVLEHLFNKYNTLNMSPSCMYMFVDDILTSGICEVVLNNMNITLVKYSNTPYVKIDDDTFSIISDMLYRYNISFNDMDGIKICTTTDSIIIVKYHVDCHQELLNGL